MFKKWNPPPPIQPPVRNVAPAVNRRSHSYSLGSGNPDPFAQPLVLTRSCRPAPAVKLQGLGATAEDVAANEAANAGLTSEGGLLSKDNQVKGILWVLGAWLAWKVIRKR